MPATHRTIYRASFPKSVINSSHRQLSTSRAFLKPTSFRRTDFSGQGFESHIDPSPPVVGPLSKSSKLGAPRLTPYLLKEHLDKFVVGQDKAKKVTSVAIYNHYQRIRELRRQEAEEVERYALKERRSADFTSIQGIEKRDLLQRTGRKVLSSYNIGDSTLWQSV